MLSLLIPFGILIIIIFAIVAMIEGKTTMKKGRVIRSLYFYLTSLITLAIVVGSLIYLINLGLKSYAFKDADAGLDYAGAPPTLFLDATTTPEAAKPVGPIDAKLSCEKDCTLTETQKTGIESWKTNYQQWQRTAADPSARRTRDAVAALSFFLVALPFFIIHFRVVQKDAKQQDESEPGAMRPMYFYFVALASLVMIVVAGGFLINVGLKTWVFPKAGQVDQQVVRPYIAESDANKTVMASLVDCADKCGIDAETKALAQKWQTDYDSWQARVNKPTNTNQRQAATSIPYVFVGIPLFWYHWTVARRESKERKQSPPTMAT